ncbi:Coupling of ubiquitin conjugation to ER degradation 3 [Hyphodiscus hymeniophilus]|uniref:Coupling of ubiquitin conjugation to ER degradation 3 n=1 Tax=Hyphodiscus hymeniophilus TaxID=353542 RepID=A0A9P6VFW5_9HELO|nr:Coupling of ubiquitin conjugation to ER degradation 3 [Hyphodiscus hymeniophilus]
MASKLVLPPMVPFPETAWRNHLIPEEWNACLDAWISLAEAHLSLPNADFARQSAKDASLPTFLTSFAAENSQSHNILSSSDPFKARALRKHAFLLSYRLLEVDNPPEPLLQWQFLADISKVYGKSHTGKLLTAAWKQHESSLEVSISQLKNALIKELDAGLKGDLKATGAQLKRLDHLLHASPKAASFFMAGSDFVDSLIHCYKLMNPPLRKAILSTLYLCLIGLTEGEKPNFSSLVDQLYSLKTAAEIHKVGPTNVNDSLVAELVTATPILRQVQQRIDSSGSGSNRAKSVITALEGFRKPGGSGRPHHLISRKFNKGTGIAKGANDYGHRPYGQIHIHRMSLISQIQDLFPDLGSSFVVKVLDEYNDDVEQVITHLLEGSLPSHLETADRFEELDVTSQITSDYAAGLVPHSTPPQLPSRRNVFDDDEFDQLAVDTSRLHFGRRNPEQTADDVLQDRSNAPNKVAILSALAAFDSDDDERDDTYDVEDVGGTVDSAAPGNNTEEASADVTDGHDEALFRAYKATPKVFERDATTRRSKSRISLKEETGMTDEAIEGWGLMLSRDSRQMRRLEAKFSTFTGSQKDLAPTAWRASPAGSGTEESDVDGNHRGRGGSRMRSGRGGRGRGRGNVAGLTGEKETEVARQRKEAKKGSRANHNRRDQRARKMARGGFPG